MAETLPQKIQALVREALGEVEGIEIDSELDALARDYGARISRTAMDNYDDVTLGHAEQLTKREEDLQYHVDRYERAQERLRDARALIASASSTPPHEWPLWESEAQKWLGN